MLNQLQTETSETSETVQKKLKIQEKLGNWLKTNYRQGWSEFE